MCKAFGRTGVINSSGVDFGPRERDAVIIGEYKAVSHTADEIAADPLIGAEFWRCVNAKLPAELRFDIAEGNRRLLNLRRRGEAKGGLPRKRRRKAS